MNYDLFFAIIFYGFLILFFYKNRKKVQIHSKIIAFYRTKLGLKWMDKIAETFPRLLNVISYVSIFTGFAGMSIIVYFIIKGTYDLVFNGGAPALAPVLPGVRIPGLSITLGFWHWILAIFFVAVVHEFSHGVFARWAGLKVKSSGVALFGPILAAFVEPDEEKLVKKSKRKQLAILSAGPFSNIVFAFVFLLIGFLTAAPLESMFFESNGMIVNRLLEDMPAENAGLEVPFVIYSVSGVSTEDTENFILATETFKPNKMVKLVTNKGDFEFKAKEHPDDSSKGYIGVADFSLSLVVKEKFSAFGQLPWFAIWFNKLIVWLFIINLGVGLFNLLPLGIVDGGRMYYLLALAVVKNEKIAKKLWTTVSLFILFLILINLLPYFKSLFLFLGSLI
jgi:membrane-associated protease RseP (regulator of RpoE activity)